MMASFANTALMQQSHLLSFLTSLFFQSSVIPGQDGPQAFTATSKNCSASTQARREPQ